MLKELKLQMALKQKRAALSESDNAAAAFKKRQDDLTQALEEAKTDDDFKVVEEQINDLERETQEAGLDEKRSALQNEITSLEKELEELKEREKAAEQPGEVIKVDQKEREATKMNKLQVRELLKNGQYYERAEVKQFYDDLKARAANGGELTIPNIVVNRIMDIMGDYATVYPLVDKIKVSGTARILIDTDTTAAAWMEQNAAIPEGDAGKIVAVDFDGFKCGKIVLVDNYLLQDSIINLDDYITKKIARALAMAIDDAILNGKGSADKQPQGIITAMAESSKAEVIMGKDMLADLAEKIGLIDTGEDATGRISVVMHRQTYYKRLVRYSINVDSSGNVVGKLPNLSKPDLVGLPVVFNNHLPEDKVLIGDFEKYTLVEREAISLERSDQVKFMEDKAAFRGKGRFDGKPTRPEAFALVTIKDAADEPTA